MTVETRNQDVEDHPAPRLQARPMKILITFENPGKPPNCRHTCDGGELQRGVDVGHVDGDAGAELRFDLVFICFLLFVRLCFGNFGWR